MQKLEKIICNASPIIGLSKIGLLHLLWDLFEEIYVPSGVFLEITEGNKLKNFGKHELQGAVETGQIKLYSIENTTFLEQFYGRLHRGELEVIIAAKETGIGTAVIDDLSARKFADTMLVKTIGVVGILLLAKRLGKIEEIKKYLDLLIANKYRISDKLYRTILNEAEES